MDKKVKSPIVYILALMCLLGWLLSIFVSFEPHGITVLKTITWLYLLIAYLSKLDKLVEKVEYKKHISMCVIQFLMFSLVFLWEKLASDEAYLQLFRKCIIFALILAEISVRYIAESARGYLVEKSTSKYDDTQKDETPSEERVNEYVFWQLLYLFKFNKENKEKAIVDKAEEERIKIVLLNSASFLIVGISYVFKVIIDLINISAKEYHFPQGIIFLYLLFAVLFLAVNFYKSVLLEYSIIKTIFTVLCTYIAVYFFVFKQYGNINFVMLMLNVYFITPFLLDIWRVGRRFMSWNHN